MKFSVLRDHLRIFAQEYHILDSALPLFPLELSWFAIKILCTHATLAWVPQALARKRFPTRKGENWHVAYALLFFRESYIHRPTGSIRVR